MNIFEFETCKALEFKKDGFVLSDTAATYIKVLQLFFYLSRSLRLIYSITTNHITAIISNWRQNNMLFCLDTLRQTSGAKLYARQLQISFDRNYLIFVTLKSIWCPKWPISRQSCFYCLRFATTLLLSANLYYVRKNGKIIEINIFFAVISMQCEFWELFFKNVYKYFHSINPFSLNDLPMLTRFWNFLI